MAKYLKDRVTLNCDLGEAFSLYKSGDDDSILDLIDLANVACGFHAGDFSVMAETVKKAKQKGVHVGAHPSFPDLQGFGRRAMALTADEVKHSVMYQVGALKAFLDAEDIPLSHIKPHGSLYFTALREPEICKAIIDVCLHFGVPLLGCAGSLHETLAKQNGVPFLGEFFTDLDYEDNGRLVLARRHEPVGPETAVKMVKLAMEGKHYSKNGKEFPIQLESISIHSDTPDAVETSRLIRAAIDEYNFFGNTRNADVIKSVLIANRGEIACRVIKTCEKMGIKTFAVYEQADDTMHSLEADESVELPNGSKYTSIEAIVDICKGLKVDAVHPGYGFLSENPDFCKAVEDIGVTFLGPTSDVIRKFGLKHQARELAVKAGVPVVPGSGILPDVTSAAKEANLVGYPVMLKATGGGGGIGMHVCQDLKQLENAFQDCQTSAQKYFGNSGVYLEKYYPNSRHIEVQIFGDGRGEVIHLGERECSVQRRNQKVIEETPSPFLLQRPQLRFEMCEAAVRLAKSVNYRSAGTVEFLVEGDQGEPKFFFLEVNTRIQVEHAVTEMVNGIDLVEWMICLGSQTERQMHVSRYQWKPQGHAIEARIYAENPCMNFSPSPGLLTEVKWPSGREVRVDTWVKSGTKVSTAYDPLLGKVIAEGKDREDALESLLKALQDTVVAGPFTNLDYLATLLKHDDFISGNTTTNILKTVRYSPLAVRVLQGGADTTIQDWPGRIGLRVYGIQPNGPADDLAFRVANILVGNEEGLSGLEMTLNGPKLYFYVDTLVAVTGADMDVTLALPGGQRVSKPTWSRFQVPAGGTLSIGKIRKGSSGCRAYLAVFGGFDVPDYLGSKSTFAAFGYGGFQGRSLQANDMIPLAKLSPGSPKCATIPADLRPSYQDNWEIKVMPGPHADPDIVLPEGMREFFSCDWEVHYNSSKMGVRLLGPSPQWARQDGGEGGSHPSNIHDVGYGLCSINFTGDSPVILTRDGPTQGGFTCPWTIVSAEMWKTGQVSPGDRIHFRPISFEEALSLSNAKDAYLAQVKQVATFYPVEVPLSKFPSVTDTAKSDSPITDYLGRAILAEMPADQKLSRPQVQYRQSGDCYVLIEYGDPKGAFELNNLARLRMLELRLGLETKTDTQKAEPLFPGTLDAAPSIRSLLIRYDPKILPQSTLIEYLKSLEKDLPDASKVVFPSRDIKMPLVFDDRWTQAAADMYRESIRQEACYLPSNVEFIAKNNGLNSKSDLLKYVAGSPFLVVGVGFFLGCPFLCPINPLHRIRVPKYNPSRVFTPAGTVGLGGSLNAIYPLDTPGGYQMYGRTTQTWDTFGSVQPFTPHQPWLLNFFDKVTFHLVPEDELLQSRRLASAGKLKYDITPSTFDMADYNKLAAVTEELIVWKQQQKEASARLKAIEDEILRKQRPTAPVRAKQDQIQLPQGQHQCQALLSGLVKSLSVKNGDRVIADQTVLCVLEAMKTEMEVRSDLSGVVVAVTAVPNQQVSPLDTICILQTN